MRNNDLMPNSAELLVMAEREWHNREERQGIHPKNDWCAGWISGYLTAKHEFVFCVGSGEQR